MEIQYQIYHGNRELEFCPPHFVKTNTICTLESRLWIYEKCLGRFCFLNKSVEIADFFNLNFLDSRYPAFEDPQEAVMYELTWS